MCLNKLPCYLSLFRIKKDTLLSSLLSDPPTGINIFDIFFINISHGFPSPSLSSLYPTLAFHHYNK